METTPFRVRPIQHSAADFRPDGHEPQPDLLAPTEGQDNVADYAHTALSLRRHPLARLHDRFTALKLKTAAQVNAARYKQPVRAAELRRDAGIPASRTSR